MEKIILKIDGMTCGHCVGKVEKSLKSLPGVEVAKVDLKKGTAKVKYDDSKQTIDKMNEAVREAGYESESTSKRWLI
ncbi:MULTISPECIES: copper ion binding protein [unclassified Bacillus (in: firmicutes)]|uniref:heavy-metal-associated domain-containing protein n=1 Tax=unclassified Bacillus (in: firmicutes) TaxID=185979 RepID=UPI001BED2A48|nr:MULTISPECIES: copper ion binding protein [unclassified Bacillus (in: firmicutes)]MBT2638871.1 heavy-metal-associated domain-containing protein [Bacillus sp. ISL-39]MBT2663076.1 heavy-metal-associated domain-containing protein [Bacillus sp. ISL-45]